MKPRSITLLIVMLSSSLGLSGLAPDSSSGQLPETNRKIFCGCYCGGTTPGYYVVRDRDCTGIIAADACGETFSSLPEADKRRVCTSLKEKAKPSPSCPLPKEMTEYCKSVPDEKCEKPTPWFDTFSSSGCKDVQDTQISVDQKTFTATVSMCGYQVLKHVSRDFVGDKLFTDAYRSIFNLSIPKKVCCDAFNQAARTGTPCDPRRDLDCDGTPNDTDLVNNYPAINTFTRSKDAPIDPFPTFSPFDSDFSPNSAARDSKGVGDCDCKWQLIKGELRCNSVTGGDGKKQHVYTATWRCPSTNAEVFTTKYAPSTAPCP